MRRFFKLGVERHESRLHLGAGFAPVLYDLEVIERTPRSLKRGVGVKYGTAVLVHDKNDRQAASPEVLFLDRAKADG